MQDHNPPGRQAGRYDNLYRALVDERVREQTEAALDRYKATEVQNDLPSAQHRLQHGQVLTASATQLVTDAMDRQQKIFQQASAVNQSAVDLIHQAQKVDWAELQKNAQDDAREADSARQQAKAASTELEKYGVTIRFPSIPSRRSPSATILRWSASERAKPR